MEYVTQFQVHLLLINEPKLHSCLLHGVDESFRVKWEVFIRTCIARGAITIRNVVRIGISGALNIVVGKILLMLTTEASSS